MAWDVVVMFFFFFFFSSRRRHTRLVSDWSSDVCSSDLSNLDTLITHAKCMCVVSRWRHLRVAWVEIGQIWNLKFRISYEPGNSLNFVFLPIHLPFPISTGDRCSFVCHCSASCSPPKWIISKG